MTWEVSGGLESQDLWVERSERAPGPWARLEGKRTRDQGVVTEFDNPALTDRAYWYRLAGIVGGRPTVLTELVWVGKAVVQAFRLESVGPSPGRGRIAIRFALPVPSDVSLEIFDIQGRSVSSLVRGIWPAGEHVVEWNERHQSGLYLVRYRFPGGEETRRVIRTGG